MPFNNSKSRKGVIKGSALDKSPLKQTFAETEFKGRAKKKVITKVGKKLGLRNLVGRAVAPVAMLKTVKNAKEAMHKDKFTPKWVTGSSWQDKTDIKIKDTRPDFLKGSFEK